MIKNYLKVAWRNVMKNKTFSFINIFGLSVGLTCCFLIAIYLQNELSYDTHHKHGTQLYQLGTTFVKNGKDDRTANTPAPMAKAMQQEFPEIVRSTRLLTTFAEDKTLIQYTTPSNELKSFYETDGFLADSTFFQMFDYNFKEGNPETALTQPNTVVLSSEIAEKLFGKEPAINKTVRISSSTNGDYDFRVSGVFTAGSTPTHIDGRFFMSIPGGNIAQYISERTDLASNNMFYTYFQLHPKADAKQLESKFPAFIDKHAGKELKALGFYKKQFLIPVADIHLQADVPKNVTPPGSKTYLYILASIAAFTLLIACINFMNLSTARSSKRAAEVGVRKVLGAERRSLVRQFLGESVLMAIVALLFGIVITQLLLPLFAEISGKHFSMSLREQFWIYAGFFGLALITGLLAGSYPAFYLSSFRPIKVLKGKISNSLAAVSLRKSLVIFQFVISVVLIIASVVINKQMNYLQSKDLGFDKEQQIVVPLRSSTAKKIYSTLKNEISANSLISSVGASLYYPGIFNPSDMPLYRAGASMNESKRVFMNWVDDSFLQTLDIKPAKGRFFSKAFPSDSNARMILNETAIKQLGYGTPEDAVGKYAVIDWQGESYRYEIVGVAKDFHFQDLHVPIEPYGFQLIHQPQFNYLLVHAKPGDIKASLTAVETIWRKLNPNEPFDYSFLDQDFNKNYQAENRLSSIVGYFTIIAILISCLGLFGLAAFSAEQRTKEIGVRKVLGASVAGLVGLLSKDFMKLVAIAVLIASPVAWLIMNKWLQDFAFRTGIGWQVFAITGLVALFVAIVTISFQAIRAALSNPVKSLRTE